jgi:hypothetical protein
MVVLEVPKFENFLDEIGEAPRLVAVRGCILYDVYDIDLDKKGTIQKREARIVLTALVREVEHIIKYIEIVGAMPVDEPKGLETLTKQAEARLEALRKELLTKEIVLKEGIFYYGGGA